MRVARKDFAAGSTHVTCEPEKGCMSESLLSDKHIVITGASRGIGRALATCCARHGATVAIGYHSGGAEADALQLEIRQRFERDARALRFDVTDPAMVATAVTDIMAAWGRIDGWVNAAGVRLPSLLVTSETERIEHELRVNLLGPMWCARAVVPHMLKQKRGVILNISSVAAVRPYRGQTSYAAAKGGLEAFTRALAVEVARKGIRALCLRPGAVDTAMLASSRALDEEELLGRIPQRRIATPDEIAELAVFLLSDRAAYLTATEVTADGGYVVA
jgi:3-oxoacyl-[acyl-carrier protein] reductase